MFKKFFTMLIIILMMPLIFAYTDLFDEYVIINGSMFTNIHQLEFSTSETIDSLDLLVNDQKTETLYSFELLGSYYITCHTAVQLEINDWFYSGIYEDGLMIIISSLEIDNKVYYIFYDDYDTLDFYIPASELRSVRLIFAKSKLRPTISGPLLFTTAFHEQRPLDYFLAQLTVNDQFNDLTYQDFRIIADTYTSRKENLGIFECLISASNLWGSSVFRFKIKVIDRLAPIIIGDFSTLVISYQKYFDTMKFIKSLKVQDNLDSLTWEDIEIIHNDYELSSQILGTYELQLKISDYHDNVSYYTKKIIVVDDVKPEFSGVTRIVKSSNSYLSIHDILKNLTATDIIDGDLTNSIGLIHDYYSANFNKPGEHEILFTVSDQSGNQTNHLIQVVIIESQSDWVVVNTNLVIVAEGSSLTNNELLKIYQALHHLSFDINHARFLTNFEINYSVSGIYSLSFTIDNDPKIHNLNIQVYGDNSSLNLIPSLPSNPQTSSLWWLWVVIGGLIAIGVSIGIIVYRKKKPRQLK